VTEESEISKALKVKDSKKGAQTYLKSIVEERDRSLGLNFSKGNFALAANDAERMLVCLKLLSEIDVNS
jgi:hypothetical protein